MIKFTVGKKYRTREGLVATCVQTGLDKINNDNRYVAKMSLSNNVTFFVRNDGSVGFDRKPNTFDVICQIGGDNE